MWGAMSLMEECPYMAMWSEAMWGGMWGGLWAWGTVWNGVWWAGW